MKEFMKQTDVASEFLSFLREVNLYDVYLDGLKKECYEIGFGTKANHMKIFAEVKQNLEGYMLLLSEKEPIINLRLPIEYRILSVPMPSIYSLYGNFEKWFNTKYKDEIRKQKIIVGKLLLRYLKDNKMLMGYNDIKRKKDESVTFVNVFDKKIDESLDLFSTFPQWVGISTYKILGDKTMAKISDDFRNYYIKMVNQ